MREPVRKCNSGTTSSCAQADEVSRCRKRPLVVLIQIIFGILELTQVIMVRSAVLASQKRFFLRSLLLEKSHLLPDS